MAANDAAGKLFIREDAILPGGLIIETETFLPGWRAVRDCNGYRLGRRIEEVNWNFFFLAGEVTATLLGRVGPSTLQRAVASIVAKPAARKFNSLEVSTTRSRWFLGIPFVTVTGHFRHIQQGLALGRANDFTQKGVAASQGAPTEKQFEPLASRT
jgi:hypothetical protein